MNLLRRFSATLLAPLILGFVLPECTPAAQSGVYFYFSPHPDDWQLFMNPNAWQDILRPGSRVVIFYVTAGDGGNGSGPAAAPHPYFLARENGARMALRFVVDGANTPADLPLATTAVNGHAIARYVYRNTVSYFLRLPDGSLGGTGYASTGFQSLERLHKAEIASLTAVDQSTTYNGWSDLVATVMAAIRSEMGACAGGWANLPDPDAAVNPGDHPDHYQTAALALDTLGGEPYFNKAYYVDYAKTLLPENLPPSDQQIQIAAFAQVIAGINAFGWAAPWDDTHRSWLGKEYYRVETVSAPPACSSLAGACLPPQRTPVLFPRTAARCHSLCCAFPGNS